MPVLIKEYIDAKLRSISLTPEALEQRKQQFDFFLKKILHFPPSNLDTRASIHFSDVYREKSVNYEEKMVLITYIVEKIFSPITFRRETIRSCSNFWGRENLPTDLEQSQRLYLVQNAAIFSYTDVGNCAKRTSYASIELFDIFKHTNVQIQLVSHPEIDQFVLKIGNKHEGWKIYDPLTNPLVLFEEQEYIREIKSLFKHVPTPKQAVNFTVDLKTIELFEFQLRKITKFLSKERQNTTIDTLKGDLLYYNFLREHHIRDPQFEKTEAAYSEVCDLLGWDDPKSEINHGLS